MVDYRKMYSIVCTAASEALDELPDIAVNAKGRQRLQDALLTAEELYLRAEEDVREDFSRTS